jgi:microcystin-dependent protein
MHPGQGPGLSLHDLGETGGSRTVKLLESEMPAHSHGWVASHKPGTNQSPVNEMFAAGVGGITMYAEAVVQIYINVDVGFQGSISRVDPTTKQESNVAYLRGTTTIHVAEPGTEWRFSIPEAESYITTNAPVQNVGITPSPTGGFKVIVHETPVTDSVVTQLASNALATEGGNKPHNNMMPYLTLNFCIAVEGLFPSRT